MYLYNVTFLSEEELGETVLERLNSFVGQHLLSDYAPHIKLQLLELQDSPNEGITFCLQIVARDPADLSNFNEEVLNHFLEAVQSKHMGKVLSFSTQMKFLTTPISL